MSKGRYVLPRWLDENLTPDELRAIVEGEMQRHLVGELLLPPVWGRVINTVPGQSPEAATYTTYRAESSPQWSEGARLRVEETVREGLARAQERLTRELFGLPSEPPPPTTDPMAALSEAIRRVRSVLYYAEHEALPQGKVLHGKAGPGWPEVLFCHPDDLPTIREHLAGVCELRPFREWSPGPEDIEAAFQAAIAAMGKDGTK